MVSSGRPIIRCGIALLLLLLLLSLVAGAGAYEIDGGTYSVRYNHTIAGTGTTLDYYQVPFTLSNATGTSSGQTIYTNGLTKPDWRDVRFASTADAVYPHWIESTTATTAKCWVNVSSIPTDGTYVRIYFDSDDAVPSSNGVATFPFFEDWTSFDTGKWLNVTKSGTVGLSGGLLTLDPTGTSHGGAGVYAKRNLTAGNYSIEARLNRPGQYASTPGLYAGLSERTGLDSTYYGHFGVYSGTSLWYASTTQRLANYATATAVTGGANPDFLNVWVRTTATYHHDAATVAGTYVYESTGNSYTVGTATGARPLYFLTPVIYYGEYGNRPASYCDWYFVRTLAVTEPSHGATVMDDEPAASFTANATAGALPLTVQFTSTTTNTTNWSWSFGDGNTSFEENPTHTYTTDGIFTVALTASNEHGFAVTEQKTDYIFAGDYPKTRIETTWNATTPFIATPFVGQAYNFTPTTWNWDWGDSTTDAATRNATHRFALDDPAVNQTFTVTLTASNATWSVDDTMAVKVLARAPTTATESFNATDGWSNQWTFQVAEGEAAAGKCEIVQGTGTVVLHNYVYAHYAGDREYFYPSDLVYSSTDAVTFHFYLYSAHSNVGYAYSDRLWLDLGTSKIQIKNPWIEANDAWSWITVEYDGANHARVNGGSWQTVDTGATWTPKFEVWHDPLTITGETSTGKAVNWDITIDYFSAVRSTPAFTVSADHGAAPLDVMPAASALAYNVTSWNWSWGDGTYNATASPGNHTYTATADLYRLRLQTTSDTFGMESDSSRAIATGDYDFVARPYAARMGNVTATATNGNHSVGTYWYDWIIEGSNAYVSNSTSSLSMVGRFESTGSNNLILRIGNASLGCAYTVAHPVSVRQVNPPRQFHDTFGSMDAWTHTTVSYIGYAFTRPVEKDMSIATLVYSSTNRGENYVTNPNLVYNRSDAVTFKFRMYTSIPSPGIAYYSRVWFDFGTTNRTELKNIGTGANNAWEWYTVEYDGANHVRVNNGTWRTVDPGATWSPRIHFYNRNCGQLDNSGTGGSNTLSTYIDDFRATVRTPAFTVDTDHGASAPLVVNWVSTAYNATSHHYEFGDGYWSDLASSGHMFNTTGLFRLRLQTVSDCYGMDSDSSRGIAIGDYGFDARPYAAKYGNVSVTARVDDRPVGTYQIGWVFDGQDGYSVNSSATLSAVGRFNQTGTRNIGLYITNASTGARYEVMTPVSVKTVNAVRQFYDTFGMMDAWTTSGVGGYAFQGSGVMNMYTSQWCNNSGLQYVTATNPNLVYNRTDPVTFTLYANVYQTPANVDTNSRLAVVIGNASVILKRPTTTDQTYGWYTVEYDGANHARCNNGTWQTVDPGATWSPKIQVYALNQYAGGYQCGGSNFGIIANIDSFAAVSGLPAFTVDIDHGAAPLPVTVTGASAWNATSYAWAWGDGATNATASPGSHQYAAGLWRLRLQTVSDTYGMDGDGSVGVVAGNYGFDARPYAAKYGNVSVTANVDDRPAGTYQIGWIFEGNDDYGQTSKSASSLTATGRFESTGTKYIALIVKNTTTGAQYVVRNPVVVQQINAPNQYHDTFTNYPYYQTIDGWTYAHTSGNSWIEQLSDGTVYNYNYHYYTNDLISRNYLSNPNLVYNRTDHVTFRMNVSGWSSVPTLAYWNWLHIVVGNTSIRVKNGNDASQTWGWHTVEYGGNSSVRVDGGAWQAVDPGTTWYPKIHFYTTNKNAANATGGAIYHYFAVDAFTATRTNFTFAATPNVGAAPLEVQFSDAGYNMTSWLWSFDDGVANSTAEAPTHTYDDVGIYSPSLTAYSSVYGMDQVGVLMDDYINVGQPPNASFTGTPRYGTAPLTVQFNDTSANATGWNWSFGDGNYSSLQNPSHEYAANGNYTVSLNATNIYSYNISTVPDYVSVGDAPIADFDANVTAGVAPLNVSFTVKYVGGPDATAWWWDIDNDGDVDYTTQNCTHTYADNGNYSVNYTAANLYGSSTMIKNDLIAVGDPPVTNFTADPRIGVKPLEVQFNDTSTGNATNWSWSFGDGNVSFVRNATNVYGANGLYNVSLTAANCYGSYTLTRNNYIDVGDAPAVNFSGTPRGGVAPLAVQFTDTSLGNPTAWGWDFDGDLVADSILQNPTHIFTEPGVHTVGLFAVNAYGNATEAKVAYITVVGAVTADFAANVTVGAPPMTVQFNATTANATNWSWSFGDGNASFEENPVHTYDAEGLYTVSLNASNAYDFAVETKTDYVQAGEPPVAGFVANHTLGEVPFTVLFTDQSTNATSYAWDIDNDGDTDYTTANVTHTYTAAGNYTVNQTVANLFGPSTEVKVEYILVGNATSADFVANRTVVAVDDAVGFTSSATNATNWSWDFGDGDPNPEFDENPWHIYLEPGLYTVTLNASSLYGFAVETKVAYIDAGYPPTAAFTANRTVVAVPGAVAFTDASTGDPTAWTWVWHDGTPNSTGQNPIHTYTNADFHDVQLLAENQYGTSWSNETGYIDAGYAPVAGGFVSEQNVTPFEAVVFADTSEFETDSWNWSFGDGAYSIEPNTTHAYTTTGNYTVRLNVSNAYGADETVIDTIRVGNAPVAAFTANDTVGAPGHGVAFTDTSVTEGYTTWQWTFGDGSPVSLDQHPTHVYAATGLYTVSLRVWTPFGVSYENKTAYVDIGDPPVAAFSGSPLAGAHPLDVTFTDASTETPTAWSWSFGDGSPASALQHPSHEYTVAGNFTVALTASNAYGSDTETKAAYITVGTAPTAAFSADTTAAQIGDTITFTDASTGSQPMTAWTWDFGDGSAVSHFQHPTHAYAAEGEYTVALSVANAWGVDSETKVGYIYIGSGANASFTALPLSGPSPLTVQFTDTSQGATAWAWDFDGDGIADSTEQHPSYTFTTDGFYDVSLTATNLFGGTTMTKPSYVMAGPLTARNLRAAFSMDVKTGPEPLTVQFTDTSKVAAGSGEYARAWDFGDGSAPSAEESPVHVYAEDGKYDVELVITSQEETDTARQEKAVYVYPDQAVAPHATTTFSVYATQMKDTEFDPIQIAELLPSAYTDSMPSSLFWGLVFALIFFMIWIRNGNVTLVAILGIIFAGCLMAFLDLSPDESRIGQIFLAIAIAAMFFTALMGKRR